MMSSLNISFNAVTIAIVMGFCNSLNSTTILCF